MWIFETCDVLDGMCRRMCMKKPGIWRISDFISGNRHPRGVFEQFRVGTTRFSDVSTQTQTPRNLGNFDIQIWNIGSFSFWTSTNEIIPYLVDKIFMRKIWIFDLFWVGKQKKKQLGTSSRVVSVPTKNIHLIGFPNFNPLLSSCCCKLNLFSMMERGISFFEKLLFNLYQFQIE